MPATRDANPHLHGEDGHLGAEAPAAIDDPSSEDTKGVNVKRMLSVFGYDHAPHGHAEIEFTNVHVPATNILLGEGRARQAQWRRAGSGPDASTACAPIGVAERALGDGGGGGWKASLGDGKYPTGHRLVALRDRSSAPAHAERRAHDGHPSVTRSQRRRSPRSRSSPRRWRSRSSTVPSRSHGGGGSSGDFELAAAWAGVRTSASPTGPDEVHLESTEGRTIEVGCALLA